MLLDEFEPEREVRWPCPLPGSPSAIIAVDPEFWADPGTRLPASKRERLLV